MLARLGVPVLLAAGLCVNAPAQKPDATAAAAPQTASIPIPPLPQGRLSGIVTCADTHRPARGAIIVVTTLAGSPISTSETVRTGQDGRYIADHLPAGDYTIQTYFPGYVSRQEVLPVYGGPEHAAVWKKAHDADTAHYSATVREGGTAEINEVLQRGVAFSGRVLYSDGSPATQVTLFVQPAPASSSSDAEDQEDDDGVGRNLIMADRDVRTRTLQSIVTDDRGVFRIAGFPPGAYTVGAALPPPNEEEWLPHHGTMGNVGLMPGMGEVVLYAGRSATTLHLAQAAVYKLTCGEEARDIEITLPADGFHTVSGRLLAADGRPITVGFVSLTDKTDEDLSLDAAPLHRDGSFTFFNVPNGSYTLDATDAYVGKLDPRITSVPLRDDLIDFVPDEGYADGSLPVLVTDHDVTDLVLTLQKAPPEPPGPPAASPTRPPK